MKKLAIYVAGGHGKTVADIAMLNNWREIFFYDENFTSIDSDYSFKVIGNLTDLLDNILKYDAVFVAIGESKLRMSILKKLDPAKLITLIHPSSVISKNSLIGNSTVIMPSVVMNANSRVGNGCILNTGSILEHDCILKDGVHLAPNSTLCANVEVGHFSWIGAGSTIIQGIKIGNNSVIGAGSVVIDDVNNEQRIAGNPADSI